VLSAWREIHTPTDPPTRSSESQFTHAAEIKRELIVLRADRPTLERTLQPISANYSLENTKHIIGLMRNLRVQFAARAKGSLNLLAAAQTIKKTRRYLQIK
jgi:hypothetical protein